MRFIRRYFDVLVVTVAVVAYAFVTLWPASRELFRPLHPDTIIGDGTDQRGLVWEYEIIWNTMREHPARLFFGAVFTFMRDAPEGTAMWIPWNEKFVVLLVHPFTTESTRATAVAWVLLTLNGLGVAWLGRSFKWPWYVTLPVALAFSCNPYTRGRTAVHMALCCIFYLPLVLGALERLATIPNTATFREARGTLAKCTIAFLLAGTASHYYLLITAVSVPMFVWFLWLRMRDGRVDITPKRIAWIVMASAPAILFLGWCFLMPVPPSLKSHIHAFPAADPNVALAYLHDVGAHPIDYFGGDVKLGVLDVIKLRSEINTFILTHIDSSHPQERANGIRWTFIALAIAAIGSFAHLPRSLANARGRRLFVFLMGLASFAFLMSLSPRGIRFYEDDVAPSLFVNKLLPNLRVPSRWGPVVGLAVTMMGAQWLTRVSRSENKRVAGFGKALSGLVAVLVVVELLPLNPMMLAPVRPAHSELVRPSGACGMGIFLPFQIYDYWATEETRGTPCALVYPSYEGEAAQLEGLAGYVALQPANPRFVALAKCMGIDWLVFRQPVVKATCDALGFEVVHPDSCRSPHVEPVKRTLRECMAAH